MPTYEIDGIPFIVEVDNGVLRSTADSSLAFEFSHMEDKGTHYVLYRDPNDGRQIDPVWLDIVPTGYIASEVPQTVMLDAKGIEQKYGIEVGELPAKDADLVGSQELFQMREKGRLPTIKIFRQTFIVDLRMGYLRPKDDFRTMGIKISALSYDRSGTRYVGIYDRKRHELFAADWSKLTDIPRDAIPIALPLEHVLDPYHVARRDGLLEDPKLSRSWFREFPVRYNLAAQTLPWNETVVPEQIKKNREKTRLAASSRQVIKTKTGRGPKP